MGNGAGPRKIREWFNNSGFETAALAQALANRTPRFGDSGTQYLKYSRSAKLGYAFIKKANIGSGTTGNSGESSSLRSSTRTLVYRGRHRHQHGRRNLFQWITQKFSVSSKVRVLICSERVLVSTEFNKETR
jgi:hypothetical protein